jgi:hypothetical protein
MAVAYKPDLGIPVVAVFQRMQIAAEFRHMQIVAEFSSHLKAKLPRPQIRLTCFLESMTRT